MIYVILQCLEILQILYFLFYLQLDFKNYVYKYLYVMIFCYL
jgi:hypothetical protein